MAAVSDSRASSQKPTDVAVYTFLIENDKRQGIQLPLDDGLCAEAAEIHDKMLRALRIPPDYGSAFAVWMTSPHLQIQLKGRHKPCELKKKWKAMVAKFTKASVLEIETDEPILSFQRNCFLPIKIEELIAQSKVVKLLYFEAVSNVNRHRYPLSEDDFLYLGALQCLVEVGRFETAEHNLDFMLRRVQSYIPYQIRKSTWSTAASAKMFRTRTKAQKLAISLRDKYKSMSDSYPTADVSALMMSYLKYCRHFDFYGSVFFKGQVEHVDQHKAVIIDRPDRNVRIGINHDHFHMIDSITNEILVAVPLNEINWKYCEATKEGTHCFSSFFIEYDCEEGVCNQKICSQIQIYSRQAAMMDAMVYRCANNLHMDVFDKLKKACEEAGAATFASEAKPATKKAPPAVGVLKKKMSLQSFPL